MKKLHLLSICLFVFPFVACAEVSQFVFITPSQIVPPAGISKAITIQSQNSAGVSEAVTETTDLVFESTSVTGKFVAVGGKPASKTMSKNTANRTFYYTDQTPGTHTLTVTTTGRTSKKSFRVNQLIIIGDISQKPVPPKPALIVASSTSVLPKPIPVVQKQTTQKVRGMPAIKTLPLLKVYTSTSTESTSVTPDTPSADLLATVYASTPSPSALETMLWLPRKIWALVASIF